MSVRIVAATYNVHGWVGTDGRHDPQRCLRVLEEMNPDVAGLQEVNLLDDLPAGEGPAPAEEPGHTETLLAGATGMTVISGPTMQRANGSYGNLLLSRLPVVAVRRHDMSVTAREPRGALDVDLRQGELTLRVIVTHLGLNPTERTVQARRLAELVAEKRSTAVVLMGDFNQWFPWWGSLRALQRAFDGSPYHRTYPARWPLLPLDRIWVKPFASVERLAVHRSALARVASDHLPVWASLRTTLPSLRR